jgi:GNAT superfamily N-acetyltransferase
MALPAEPSTAAPLPAVPTDVTVTPVRGNADKTAFIRMVYPIYEGNPNWVAPLEMERRDFLDPKKNPFFEFGEVELFLARRGGQVVGRIAAVKDPHYNEFHGTNEGFFGLFECINDAGVARALFEAAAQWLRAKGFAKMLGPMNFSTNQECGLLVEGFDTPSAIMTTYNPPYYASLIEANGFTKAMDLWSWELSSSVQPPEKVARIAEKLRQRDGITVRSVNLKKFEEEVALIKGIYNAAWEKNWGFVPMTEHEIDHLAEQFKPVVIPDLVPIAEKDGKVIGFGITLPDLNVVFRRNRSGRLFPMILKLLWALKTRKIRRARILLLGVLPEYRGKGVDAMLYHWIWTKSGERGIYWGEAGWILEDNPAMNAGLEKMTFKVYKTYRLYDRPT